MARTRMCNIYLPEELIFIILYRLPVKTLYQLKSVCKSWRTMISNLQFVQAHLTNSKKKPPVLLSYSKYHVEDQEKESVHIDVQYTPQDSDRLYLPRTVTQVCCIKSCNGLVCLPNDKCNVIHIWNPATKQLKMLPAPNKYLRGSVYLGFGFDSISNDYKVLRIGFKYLPGREAELYSSKADSWKEIQVPQTLQNADIGIPLIVHAKPGILCMTLCKDTLYILMEFDLHKEVFRVQSIPHHPMSNVLDFEGKIAMVFESGEGSTLSLFVLNGICGEVPWTKLFNLEGDVEILRVVCYLGAGEFVKKLGDAEGTYNYNYKTRETKKYAIKLRGFGNSQVVTYTESLVSLNAFSYSYDYKTRKTKKCAPKLSARGMRSVVKSTKSLVSQDRFKPQDQCSK